MALEFYWVNFGARTAAGLLSEGSCEISTAETITRGDQLANLQDQLARRTGARSINIRTFTHLRSELDPEDGS